jgi:antitoxin YefM
MTILPIAEVKRRLSELVTRVSQQHERVVLTRNGRPAAVLISPDDLEGLEITAEVLADPEAMDRIREAEDAIERGETAGAATIRADLAARRDSA